MYELVNTSLPNGLIAGTHGFATVAMTKGLPDALRSRLEGLCAYSHRTSAHDATYYRDNPVNWFHAILPQGAHAVGRIAPSEFDYTGRTNRIAKMRIFGPDEMPEIGGAEIANRERGWFAETWSGEPRYLDDDKATCARLWMEEAKPAKSAANWESLFGRGGTSLARRFAKQLESNMRSGGKTIWFKTSPEWDVSGDKLLGLFSDIINFLPSRLRKDVTFSTYADSMIGGDACHLRGTCDGGKMFDLASTASAWVDCVSGRVVHEDLLPEEISNEGKSALPQDAAKRAKVSLSRQKGGGRREAELKALARLASGAGKADDGKSFMIWLAGGCVAFMVAFGVFAYVLVSGNNRKMRESGAEQALAQKAQADQERLERERDEDARRKAEERARKDEEARKEIEAAKRKQEKAKQQEEKEKPEKEFAEQPRKEKAAKQNEEDERKRKAEKQREKADREAFCYAKKHEIGFPKKPPVGTKSFKVYYYDGDKFVNDIAQYVAKTSPTDNSKVIDWVMVVGESKKPVHKCWDVLQKSPVVMWLAEDDTLYFDWELRMREDSHDEQKPWFAENNNSHSLQEDLFGKNSDVFEVWQRLHGKSEYEIAVYTDAPQTNADYIVKADTESVSIDYFAKKTVGKLEIDLKKIKCDFQNETNKYISVTNSLAQLRTLRSEKEQKEKEKKNIDTDKNLSGDEKRKRKKDLSVEIDRLKKQIDKGNSRHKESEKVKIEGNMTRQRKSKERIEKELKSVKSDAEKKIRKYRFAVIPFRKKDSE